ncbi:hypothetical protein [Metabacillus halosaccharovorans]|uniref:hypothetical protein n=1 Tax=Metabacillus halosaccharovorans TaxID=930124 RepID=UPI001C1FF331|nr:hypothetical protein [Metabacillus halosaccharovorans]MBU7593547.1 hypothetical protein [Metabacillus halosaccharovorans]
METTELLKVLFQQMKQERAALAHMIELLEDDGFNPEIFVREQKVYIYIECDDSHYSIETTSKGYKLVASYVDWDYGETHDIKVIERVHAETIINNINLIGENLDYYYDMYLIEKAEWKQRRKQLRRNQVIKELSVNNTSA